MKSENCLTNLPESHASEPLDEAINSAFSVFQTPPEMTVSQFADAERHLSSESSAMVGQWDTSVTENLRGVMDAVSDPAVEEVIVMSASQCGKTEVILNTLAYHIAYDPCPTLIVIPNDSMCTSLSRDRIAPMVRDSPILKGTIATKKQDDRKYHHTQNLPRWKFDIASAQSPSILSARSCRLVCFDEVDRFPASSGSEGDPVTLGKRRSVSYWNRKILMTSTPTIKGESRIETAYQNSDQRKYFVPCESCGEFQVLEWSNVQWNNESGPSSVHYQCRHCEAQWTDQQRMRAVRLGHWKATSQKEGVVGFHLSGLYSPFISLSQAVAEFTSAKGHPEILRTWVNIFLSESCGFRSIGLFLWFSCF